MFQVAIDNNDGVEVVYTSNNKSAAEAMLVRAARLFPNDEVLFINTSKN